MTDPFVPPDQPPPPPSAWGQQVPPAWGPPPPPWGQPQPWYGGWQPAPRRTNGLAIGALITGIVALVPVAIGLGIGALVQIRRRGEAGKGLAIGGLIAAGAWTLLIGGFLALGLSGKLDYRQGDLDDIASTAEGTCLLKHPSRVVDCDSPHHYEVYDTYTFEEGAWPGAGTVDETADGFCSDSFEERFGSYWSSDYDYGYFSPDRQQWRQGRRTVVCVVLDTFGLKIDHPAG